MPGTKKSWFGELGTHIKDALVEEVPDPSNGAQASTLPAPPTNPPMMPTTAHPSFAPMKAGVDQAARQRLEQAIAQSAPPGYTEIMDTISELSDSIPDEGSRVRAALKLAKKHGHGADDILGEAGADSKVARQKSLDMLAKFGLSDKSSDYPSQLSGGQRQRVAIAQQLLCSEHFIIMDEPFTGLDPLMKDLTCELISQVALMDERNTIFVVAHDIPAVTAIADTLWLLGRDRDAHGAPIPGSRIQAQYDLAALDLAWQPQLASTPRFAAFCAEVKEKFKTL